MPECLASLYEIEFNSYPQIFQYTFEIFYIPHQVDEKWSKVVNKRKSNVKPNINKPIPSFHLNKGIKLSGQNHNAFYEICCYTLERQFSDHIAHNGKETLYTLKELELDYQKIIDIDDSMADKLNIQTGSLKLSLKFIDRFDFDNSDTILKLKSHAALQSKAYALDTILSQTARNLNQYVPCGVGVLFTKNKIDLDYGLQTHEGCMKRVYSKKINSNYSFYLAMDYVQHSFLPNGVKLLDAWNSFLNGRELKDVYIQDFTNLYAGAKLQVIKEFTKIVGFKKLIKDSKNIQAETWEGVYNLSDLLIVPYQILDNKKIPNELKKKDSTLNLLERKERQKKIQKQRENLISQNDDILNRYGIKSLSNQMLKCSFTTLKKPEIIMENQVLTELIPNDKGTLDYANNHYIFPVEIENFIIQTDDSLECKDLAAEISKQMAFRGIKIKNTFTEKIEWENFNIKKAFALIINRIEWPDEMILIREKTKAMHIQWKEDLDVEMCVTKINLINGGWCHSAKFDPSFDLNDGKTFVISVDTQICHLTKKQHLFVGICSNFSTKHPYQFSGCSFIQKAVDREKASTKSPNADYLETIVKGMLKSDKRRIEKVVYLRNEGAPIYAKEEMKCIKKAVTELYPKEKIDFAGMILSKGGKIRHFYEQNGDIKDIPLYSVIPFDDDTFFMVSSVSPEDSIKGCEINVFESKDISIDELKKFLMALTTHHQSILPSGLPGPSMKSKELSKNAEYAFKDNQQPSGNALKELNEKLCPFLSF